MQRSQAAKALLAWALFLLAAVFCAARFGTRGDITHFLPDNSDQPEVAIAKTLAESDLSHTMILVVSGDQDEIIPATAALADILRENSELSWVESGSGEDTTKAFYEIFFPARFGFLSDQPEHDLPLLLSDEGLAETARSLKEQLAGPLGAVIGKTLGSDPFSAFHSHLRRLQRAQPGAITVEEGQFVTKGDRRGVIFLATEASPFSSSTQQQVIAFIESSFAEVNKEHGGTLELVMSGVNRLAVSGERSTRSDITRISTLSLLGTALLFLFCFRSLRYFVMLFVPVAFGITGGLAACLALFGDVHGMTLAFGTTLIGVSVDYTVHFLQHHILKPSEEGAHGSLRHVWAGIALGGLTTIVGFVGMAWTSTPGMRQIAVFGAAGIASALVATYAVLPTLFSRRQHTVRTLEIAHRAMSWLFRTLQANRLRLLVVPVVAIAFSVVALPKMSWNDDPSALITIDPALMEQDEEVRNIVSSADPGRFAIVEGADWEQALEKNDRLFLGLSAAVSAGELEEFQSLHQILWSADLQRRNTEQLWSSPELMPRLGKAMESAGFRAGVFAKLGEALSGPQPAPVTADDLERGGLAALLRGLHVTSAEGRVLILNRLRGVSSPQALRKRLGEIDGATYFDQKEYIASSYSGFRTRVLEVVAMSLLAVLALVWLRYRRWRFSVAAFLPAVLAATTSLALLATLGVTLNLLHVLGLMLVLSIGVDYGVFVVEAARRQDDVGIAMVGTAISCLTTILGFGLLAMSDNPALNALGLTAATGSALSFLLAPLALALVGERS